MSFNIKNRRYKALCVKEHNSYYAILGLVINKCYFIEHLNKNLYCVFDLHNNYIGVFPDNLFKSIENFREERLSILI